ncbi:hypothetical protein F4818DRAFT_136938 [Hypoxylon cercidicola]|nr:hypothetical protein F4818DRAFT_136938 [Hypoxylon cercidicola]
MEPISAIASFIAIGQALAATPKIFRVLCSLVEVRQEVTQLLHEIAMLDELWNRIKQIKNIPDDDPTARFSVPRAHLLQVIETDLGSIVTQLEELAEKFQRGTKENGKLKVDRVKWLLKRREIASLSKRAKKNREYLQEILICESFFTSTSNGSMLMEIRTMMTTQSC